MALLSGRNSEDASVYTLTDDTVKQFVCIPSPERNFSVEFVTAKRHYRYHGIAVKFSPSPR